MNAYERFVVGHHFSNFPEYLGYDEIQALLTEDLENSYDWAVWDVYEDYPADQIVRYMDEMLFVLQSMFTSKGEEGC